MIGARMWGGAVFLHYEGGYEVVMRALLHYQHRLRSIGSAPELAGAPMFAQIVGPEAQRASARAHAAAQAVTAVLRDPEAGTGPAKEALPAMISALESYRASLQKAGKPGGSYYEGLLAKAGKKGDLPAVQSAISRLQQAGD